MKPDKDRHRDPTHLVKIRHAICRKTKHSNPGPRKQVDPNYPKLIDLESSRVSHRKIESSSDGSQQDQQMGAMDSEDMVERSQDDGSDIFDTDSSAEDNSRPLIGADEDLLVIDKLKSDAIFNEK